MFKKDAPSSVQPVVRRTERVETVIGDGTRVSGEMKVDGDLRVDGEVEGHLVVSGGITVGRSGVVKADVDAASAEIAGRVVGKITARERVVLLGGSRLEGDVTSQSFKIDDGAFFQGNCVMGKGSRKEDPADAPRIQLAKGNA